MNTNSTSLGGTYDLGLSSLPLRLFRSLKTRAAERRSLAALRRLDDRLLRDVGLTRAEVETMTAQI